MTQNNVACHLAQLRLLILTAGMLHTCASPISLITKRWYGHSVMTSHAQGLYTATKSNAGRVSLLAEYLD